MELTKEKVKDWLSRTERGDLFGSNIVSDLCTALLAEMDKPKVWDGAPEDCTACTVNFAKHMRCVSSKAYTRELPKSRERQIADEVYGLLHTDVNKSSIDIPVIEKAILKYKAELEAGR